MVQRLGRPTTFSIYTVLCVVTIAFIEKAVQKTKRELLESIQV